MGAPNAPMVHGVHLAMPFDHQTQQEEMLKSYSRNTKPRPAIRFRKTTNVKKKLKKVFYAT